MKRAVSIGYSRYIYRRFEQPTGLSDWFAAHRRTLAIALVGFCAFLNLYTPQPLLPLFTHMFDASKAMVSLAVSATTIGVAIAAPWVGALADRVGRKWVIIPALLLLTLPTFLAATANGLPQLIVWRFLQGPLMAIIFAVSMAYISEESAATGVGKTMSVYVAGNVVGGFAGRFLAGCLVDSWGWRWVFVVLGSITLVGAIASALWLPAARRFTPKATLRQSIAGIRIHLRNPYLLAAYAVGFNILFSIVALFTYVNFYLAASPFHLSTAALGMVFCVYLVGAGITPVAGQWIERLGYRLSLLLASLLVSAGACLTLWVDLRAIIAGLTLSAAGIFICQSISTSYVGTTASQARSSASGLYVCAYYLGGTLGAVVPALAWAWGGWNACISLILGVQILTAYTVLKFWKH